MPTATLADRRHRFTRAEYAELLETRAFRGRALELIAGEVVDQVPRQAARAGAIDRVAHVIEKVCADGLHVRAQLSLALDEYSQPVPDVAVVLGAPREHHDVAGGCAHLVVDVAETSPAFELGVKAALYAGAGIAEYWVLDLVRRVLNVHRRPATAGEGPARYREVRTFRAGDHLLPGCSAGASVAVADLLY